MSKAVKIINLLVFCTWVTLLAILLYNNYTAKPLEVPMRPEDSLSKETLWYDIYEGAEKIGFASTSVKRVGDKVIITHERETKVEKDGHQKPLMEMMKCVSDSYYSIKSFEYTYHFKDEKGIKVTAEVNSKDIIFFFESPEKRKVFKTPLKGRAFYLPTTFIPALVQKNPSPNSVFDIPVLDIYNLSINDIKVALEEIRPFKAGINIRSLYKFKAGNSIWWSNERGMIVKEEGQSGITLYLQAEKIAKDPSARILFDYTSLPFFKSNKIIQNPEDLKMLKVKIKGFPLDLRLYQNSLVTLQKDVLTIEKEDAEQMKERSYQLPCRDDTLRSYLKADEWVLSDHKTVKGNALRMAALEKNDAFRMARYLNSNLYLTIHVMPMFILPNSLDIFKSHLGDYTERTVMFASFARASGLPTRMVSGAVYKDGYFYFHTWPEVWFGKWIPVDPTLAQFPADVTHIPLKEGTLKEIISIVDGMKNINIEIMEAS